YLSHYRAPPDLHPFPTRRSSDLELVIELLSDPLAHLLGQRLGVKPGGEALDQRQQEHRVSQVGLDRLRDSGVLDLHRHLVAGDRDRKSTRLNSSHDQISYAVFCL